MQAIFKYLRIEKHPYELELKMQGYGGSRAGSGGAQKQERKSGAGHATAGHRYPAVSAQISGDSDGWPLRTQHTIAKTPASIEW